MAYRSLSSAHPLAFSYAGASSSEGPTILLEQSPARSKAPSDGPSEFSSWHDDASSSLAPSGTARDGTITVNPLVMRMGEHLKGKLQGMIRQRFENYLHIIKTLQNDIGKLAALTCELRMADRHRSSAAAGAASSIRVSISCNEDGTFVVYAVPDAAGVLGSQCSSPASSEDKASHLEPSERSSEALPSREDSRIAEPSDVMSQWVHKVCEFGMSGRCHSLTALFHFGYTTWKQLMHGTQSAWGMESVEDVSPGHIAEEEERQLQEAPRDELPWGDTEACAGVHLSSSPSCSAAAPEEVRTPEQLIVLARAAAEGERLRQAAELCIEGLDLLWSKLCRPVPVPARSVSLASSSSCSAPVQTSASIWRFRARPAEGATGDVLVPEESSGIVCELLCVRASAYAQMQQYADALVDAETVSGIQPTCASGYYWQCVALQGMGREQEALEALMSALEYEPQNGFYQQLLTALFEDISENTGREGSQKGSRQDSVWSL
ncbi:unnamed protein product, partial [Durusdinium trenchii]